MARLPSIVLTGHDVTMSPSASSAEEANVSIGLGSLVRTLGELRTLDYEFVTFADFMDRRGEGGVALLTFDDCYKSIAELVAPMLAAEAIPALLFAVTGAAMGGSDPFPLWLHVARDRRQLLGGLCAAEFRESALIGRVMRCGSWLNVQDMLGQPLDVVTNAFRDMLSQAELDELGAIVARLPGFGRSTMTAHEIRAVLANAPVEIGAHSVTHRSFARLAKEEIKIEVARSADTLVSLAGTRPSGGAFAYPFGAVTVFGEACVARTFRAGFTCRSRPTHWLDANASLPRINLDSRLLDGVSVRGAIQAVAEVAREKFLLQARTGPAWQIIGPARNLARAIRRSA